MNERIRPDVITEAWLEGQGWVFDPVSRSWANGTCRISRQSQNTYVWALSIKGSGEIANCSVAGLISTIHLKQFVEHQEKCIIASEQLPTPVLAARSPLEDHDLSEKE